jgi:hypothetical protein
MANLSPKEAQLLEQGLKESKEGKGISWEHAKKYLAKLYEYQAKENAKKFDWMVNG